MARGIGAVVGIFLVVGFAVGDIITIPVTRENQAERSGDRLTVTPADDGAGRTRVTLRVKPAAGERFLKCVVELTDGGEVVLAVPTRAEVDAAGASVEFVVATKAAAKCRVGVLLDLTDPDRPSVGRLYRLDLGSYVDGR